MEHQVKTTRIVIILMITTLISRLSGFIRDIFIGAKYGATNITDAYIIATTIPTILFTSIASAMMTTYIPIYLEVKRNKGEIRALEFTNSLLNSIILVCFMATSIAVVFSKKIVLIIAKGFDIKTLHLAINLSKITFLMMMFLGITYIFMGYLQANNTFIITSLINIPNNLVIILMLLFGERLGIYGLTYATVFGSFMQFVIQYPFLRNIGYRYRLMMDLTDEFVRKVYRLAFPIIVGAAVFQINILIDRMLASGLVEGSISALNFSYKLNSAVCMVFIIPIATVIYPIFSGLSIEKDYDKFKRIFTMSINVISIFMFPIMIGLMILREPIISILFERGQFDYRAVTLTASTLFFYSIGVVFVGYREVLNRVFYSFHDTKTPMKNGAIALCFNIILNLILVRIMYHNGLALATSIATIITTVLLVKSLKRKMKDFDLIYIIKTGAKSLLSAIVMGVIICIIDNYFDISSQTEIAIKMLSLFFYILVGIIIYTIMLYFLKIQELSVIINFIKNKMKQSIT